MNKEIAKQEFFYSVNGKGFWTIPIKMSCYIFRLGNSIVIETEDWSDNPLQKYHPQVGSHYRSVEHYKQIKKGILSHPDDKWFYWKLKNYKWLNKKKRKN